jgi:hypothetical protein
MADETPSYNLATIRRLLLAAFTAEELRRFCQDRPLFRPILDNFGPKYSRNDMIDEVLTYCETQQLFDELLAEVKEQNPKQYARFVPDIKSARIMESIKSTGIQPPCPYLQTPKGQRSRTSHHERLRNFLDSQELSGRLPVPDWDRRVMIDPIIQLPDALSFVDCVCSAVTRHGQTLLLMPSLDSTPDVEGVGRTGVLLRLLKLAIPYGRLIGLAAGELESLDTIPIYYGSGPWCRLLAADTAYLGVSGGRLTVVPTVGEVASLAWDLARHIFRSTELQYKTGDHRHEPGRSKLLSIFDKIQVTEEFLELFGRLDRLYPVDEVIVLKRVIEAEASPPVRRKLEGQEGLDQLRNSILVSDQHGSKFWERHRPALESRVDGILSSLAGERLPRVVEIRYSHPGANIPQNVFGEIAAQVTGQSPLPPDLTRERIDSGIGIRFHNDIVMRCVDDVDELRFLVTSGEKLIKDVAFWRSVGNQDRRLSIEFLMLDPDSPAVQERERTSYRDYGSGFLASEIRGNLRTIQRMAQLLAQRAKPIRVRCATYEDLPSFRMTFLGRQRLLVSAYDEGRRTGEDTIFYDISTGGEGTLLQAFENEYQRIAAHARPR